MNEQYRYEKLALALKNDLRGLNIQADPDLLGYVLTYADWPADWLGSSAFTVYVCPEGYSAYIAIDDTRKGIAIEDEKPLLLKEPRLGAIIVAIKREQIRNGTAHGPRFANYFSPIEPVEGYRNKWERTSLDPFSNDSALIAARAELAFNDPIETELLRAEDELVRAEASWQAQDRERNR